MPVKGAAADLLCLLQSSCSATWSPLPCSSSLPPAPPARKVANVSTLLGVHRLMGTPPGNAGRVSSSSSASCMPATDFCNTTNQPAASAQLLVSGQLEGRHVGVVEGQGPAAAPDILVLVGLQLYEDQKGCKGNHQLCTTGYCATTERDGVCKVGSVFICAYFI